MSKKQLRNSHIKCSLCTIALILIILGVLSVGMGFLFRNPDYASLTERTIVVQALVQKPAFRFTGAACIIESTDNQSYRVSGNYNIHELTSCVKPHETAQIKCFSNSILGFQYIVELSIDGICYISYDNNKSSLYICLIAGILSISIGCVLFFIRKMISL
jgi:hypothetical protein